MPRFFVQSNQIQDGIVTVCGDDAHHISRALRMAVGDTITVCDMSATEYECELTQFLPDCVKARIVSEAKSDVEPPVFITLYQALPKGDKLDSVIQKAVECGVSRIVPFESERCVVRAKADSEARKTERRARIATEAAKQCGRALLPMVEPTCTYAEVLADAAKSDVVLFCYEGDGTRPIGTLLRERAWREGERVAIMIGSEGGFSVAEANAARDAGFCMTGLGKRILRTETASGFVLACISCALELGALSDSTKKMC